MYHKKKLLLQVNASSLPGMALNTARFFFKFKQMTTKQSLDRVMNIATLPPTSGSVKQHSLRAYVLIQKCHGNKLDYTQWGW